MKVLITGTSRGIGKETAAIFLQNGHSVAGIDKNDWPDFASDSANSDTALLKNYVHYKADITKADELPQIDDVEILINNAGIQSAEENPCNAFNDIDTNLKGSMIVTQKYAFQNAIKSVLFNCSVSALTGNEFPSYAASKAGLLGYMKNCAIKLANEYKATCNALCFGGVLTQLNESVIQDKVLWQKIMDVTPLKRWMTAREAAEWIYFMTVTNKFCTGQAIDVSGGERNCADLFVW